VPAGALVVKPLRAAVFIGVAAMWGGVWRFERAIAGSMTLSPSSSRG
jgi:hypothetical protein